MFKRLSMVTCMLLNMKLKIETKTSEEDLLRTKWDLRSSPPLIKKPLKMIILKIPKAETPNGHLSLLKRSSGLI